MLNIECNDNNNNNSNDNDDDDDDVGFQNSKCAFIAIYPRASYVATSKNY